MTRIREQIVPLKQLSEVVLTAAVFAAPAQGAEPALAVKLQLMDETVLSRGAQWEFGHYLNGPAHTC